VVLPLIQCGVTPFGEAIDASHTERTPTIALQFRFNNQIVAILTVETAKDQENSRFLP
jgi:hypothetical protein